MPLLRLMDALGMRQLRTLDEAVQVMRSAMLGVIQVGRRGGFRKINSPFIPPLSVATLLSVILWLHAAGHVAGHGFRHG